VLRSIVPSEIARHVDWPTLKPIRATAVSTPDRWMALRLHVVC
jgi:hypothetical protein